MTAAIEPMTNWAKLAQFPSRIKLRKWRRSALRAAAVSVESTKARLVCMSVFPPKIFLTLSWLGGASGAVKPREEAVFGADDLMLPGLELELGLVDFGPHLHGDFGEQVANRLVMEDRRIASGRVGLGPFESVFIRGAGDPHGSDGRDG